MILSDLHIKTRMADADGRNGRLRQHAALHIEGMTDPELQIQPASVDLRLGYDFKIMRQAQSGAIPQGPLPLDHEWEMEMRGVTPEGGLVLQPQQFALGATVETIGLPSDLVGRVEGRSSLGRIGLLVHATAGFIDPGFKGQITLEFYNLNPHAIILKPGVRICQISFHQMTGPAARPYGTKRGSKYQGQVGAVASRMHGDPSPESSAE